MKNHFLIAYAGNKRNEVDNIYNSIKDKLDDITTIIEPFCGTSALSYYISTKHPNKFKYVLNDNNKHLVTLYKLATDETKFNKLITILNNKIKGLNKEKYDALFKEDNFYSWFICSKIYVLRPGLFPQPPRKIITSFDGLRDCPVIKFLRTENITFYNSDAIDIMNKYKNYKRHFIFLDPPYLMACNDFYSNKNVNIYEYLYNNKINDMKALILLCLESNWIIKLLFNGQIKQEYGKKYECSKKLTTHLIISNFL